MKKVLFLTVALMLSLAMGASALTVSGPNEFPIVDEPYELDIWAPLAANIEAGKVYARETEQVWQCRNCGFVYIGTHAPVKCPVCAHPQAYFELQAKNY